MKKLYYPSFEFQKENFTKFCLLYVDEIHSIIPDGLDTTLSDNFKMLMSETKMIKKYHPKWNDKGNASDKTVVEAENILRDPIKYGEFFHVANTTEKWKDQMNWDFLIYEDKYSECLEKFIVKNKFGIGSPCGKGMLVSPEFGQLFMTILAGEISYQEELTPVTDQRGYFKFANRSRLSSRKETRETLEVLASYKMLVPNLNTLSIQKLIKFRNENESERRDFNKVFTKIMSENDDVLDLTQLREHFEELNHYHEIFNGKLAVDTVRIVLKAILAYNSPSDIIGAAIMSETLLDAAGVSFSAIEGFKSNAHRSRKMVKGANYFTNLKALE